MTDTNSIDHSRAPRAVMLLPIAMAVHIADEWFGEFPEWALLALELEIDATQFLSVNFVGFVLLTSAALIAYRIPSAAWLGISLATLFCVNTILHAGLSVATGLYSPGTTSGLLLYIPFSIPIFRWAFSNVSRGTLAGAILLGIGFHVVATLSATL